MSSRTPKPASRDSRRAVRRLKPNTLKMAARTPQTITDPQTLRKVLEGVRARGCAIEDEESELGMRCIAAPLRNDAGDVVAAIGLAGPVSRLSKKALATFSPHVIETAAAISARLGHRGEFHADLLRRGLQPGIGEQAVQVSGRDVGGRDG